MRTLDATGHRCPVPTLRLRRALERMEAGEQVLLLADDPLARIDIPHFLAQAGAKLVSQVESKEKLSFLVEKV